MNCRSVRTLAVPVFCLAVFALAGNAAAQCPNYAITQNTGSIDPGSTDIGNHCDDCLTPITLPFPVTFYGTTYTSGNASSNGNFQFGTTGSFTAAYTNDCLPSPAQITGPTIFPYWDDQLTTNAGEGIFTSVTGTSPNQIFNIEWRSHYFGQAGTANYEIRLYQGQTYIDIVYGATADNGGSATAGVQNGGTGSPATQFSCNQALLTNGLVLRFDCTQLVLGACCNNGSCSQTTQSDCANAGGTYRGDNVSCASAGCLQGDECANPLTATLGTNSFDNTNAGDSADPISCAPIGKDLWYTFSDPVGGLVTVAACSGTIADTVMAAYDGCGGPQIGCDDDGCGTFAGPSRMHFCADPNHTYMIRVGGFFGTVWSGTFDISVSPPQTYSPPANCTPENEDCNTIFPDNTNGGCNSSPQVYSIAQFCTNYCGTSANSFSFRDTDWWKFNLAQPATVTISGQADFPSQWFILSGNCPPTIIATGFNTPIACGGFDNSVSAPLGAGTFVFFCSPQNFNGDTVCGGNGQYWFKISLDSDPTCTASYDPIVIGNTVSGPAGATVLLTATVANGVNPTSTGLAVTGDLSALGGSSSQQFFDDGTHGDVTPNDNIFSFSLTIPNAQAQGSYPVPLVATDAQARAAFGQATVNVTPPNDECAGALPAVVGSNAFDNTNATDSPGTIPCALIGRDLWYTFSDPVGGIVTVSSCSGTTADSVIVAYDTCGGTVLGCDDDGCGTFAGPSRAHFCAVANQTYFLRIGGYVYATGGTIWSGTFNISVAPPETYSPPANCTPENENCNVIFPDTTNGGCNSSPPVYSSAQLCTDYCGTSANSFSFRDTDWWTFTMPQNDTVVISGQAEFSSQWFILSASCPPTIIATGFNTPITCNGGAGGLSNSVSATLSAGNYVFFVSPQGFDGSAVCGGNGQYWFRISLASDPNCTASYPPSVVGNSVSGAAGSTVLVTGTAISGINPASTGLAVTGDFSALGGSATQQMFDDGTNGDVTPNDNIFSFAFTIPGTVGDGSTPIPLTVTDAQARAGSGTAFIVTDVGELPATAFPENGPGSITTITGFIAANDADMYLIHICDPANFSATVTAFAGNDSQLFLFHTDGTGVAMDDDDPLHLLGLLSRLEGPLVTSIPAGDYYLAISSYNKDPLNGGGQIIWADTPFDQVRAPDGPGAPGPIASWNANGFNTGTYTIALTGVSGAPCPCACSGDMDGSGNVNGDDINAFVACTITGTGSCGCANITVPAFVTKLLTSGSNCP